MTSALCRLLVMVSTLYAGAAVAISPPRDESGNAVRKEVPCYESFLWAFYGGIYFTKDSPLIEFGGVPFARCAQYFGFEQKGPTVGAEFGENTALAQLGFVSRGVAYQFIGFQPIFYIGELNNDHVVGLELKAVVFFGALKVGYHSGDNSEFYGRIGIGF